MSYYSDPIELRHSKEFQKTYADFKRTYNLEPAKYPQAFRLAYLSLNRLVTKGLVAADDRRFLAEGIAKEIAKENGWTV